MSKSNGMRPHDIPVLVYITLYCDGDFKVQDLSNALFISISEISNSLKRSRLARLISPKKKVYRNALFDFVVTGLKYVYPVEPSGIVQGIGTSHSANPLKTEIISNDEQYVWNTIEGDMKGMAVAPLYPNLVKVALKNAEFYEFFSLVDALRIGRMRESNIAKEHIRRMLEIHENT